MSKKKMLPEALQDKLYYFPEYSYGANKVALVLRDGRMIENVIIAWGSEIILSDSKDKIQFDEEDIIDVLDRSGYEI